LIINIPKKRLKLMLLFIFLLGVALVICKLSIYKNDDVSMPDNSKLLVGEFLTWNEVKKAFPKYGEATVIDVDSRLSFRVQRRGGYNHVDVQPLTAADSATMKKIYNGRWTWKRKAVIVQLDNGQMIAASMNGMPHGQGAIQGNNFDGHFCIHFRDSKTHGSGRVDLAHQLMIWKAANILDEQLALLEPQEIASVFISAIDQNDIKMAGKLIDAADNIEPLLEKLETIQDLKADRISKGEDNRIKVELRIIFKNTKSEVRKNIIMDMVKQDYWKIQASSLNSLLDNNIRIELQSTSIVTTEEDWD
jgi:hypothetical protein